MTFAYLHSGALRKVHFHYVYTRLVLRIQMTLRVELRVPFSPQCAKVISIKFRPSAGRIQMSIEGETPSEDLLAAQRPSNETNSAPAYFHRSFPTERPPPSPEPCTRYKQSHLEICGAIDDKRIHDERYILTPKQNSFFALPPSFLVRLASVTTAPRLTAPFHHTHSLATQLMVSSASMILLQVALAGVLGLAGLAPGASNEKAYEPHLNDNIHKYELYPLGLPDTEGIAATTVRVSTSLSAASTAPAHRMSTALIGASTSRLPEALSVPKHPQRVSRLVTMG